MESEEKNKPKEEDVNLWKASDYLEKWNPNAYLMFYDMNKNGAARYLFEFQML